jgi:hypothetical protein
MRPRPWCCLLMRCGAPTPPPPPPPLGCSVHEREDTLPYLATFLHACADLWPHAHEASRAPLLAAIEGLLGRAVLEFARTAYACSLSWCCTLPPPPSTKMTDEAGRVNHRRLLRLSLYRACAVLFGALYRTDPATLRGVFDKLGTCPCNACVCTRMFVCMCGCGCVARCGVAATPTVHQSE